MNIAQPKTNIRRTLLTKLCFDFMVSIVSIELRFGQQVAAEAVKKCFRTLIWVHESDRRECDDLLLVTESRLLSSGESRQNGYVKGEAIDARTLV